MFVVERFKKKNQISAEVPNPLYMACPWAQPQVDKIKHLASPLARSCRISQYMNSYQNNPHGSRILWPFSVSLYQ